MPLSEDEFDDSTHMQESQESTMSKAELRKSHKPIIEKRRRARINHCLNEIKNLILEAMNKDPARHSKLEKADILEMAVKHLQNVQRQQLAIAMATDPSVIKKFKSGFNDCANEIDRYMGQSDNVDNAMKDRVSHHLQKCITGLEQVAEFSIPSIGNLPFVSGGGIFSRNQGHDAQSGVGDQNNNPRIQIPQGIQLIPSRLPTGELALLVPNSSNLPYFPTHPLPHRHSAFVTVTPQSVEPPKPLSPPMSPPEALPPSPKGFRLVQSNLSRPKPNYPGEDHQVPQVSSTVATTGDKGGYMATPMEVKTMKYPINTTRTNEKDRRSHLEHIGNPKKLSEALCVITNQGERYRQAQQKEESATFEENLAPSRGVKRGYNEMLQHHHHQGILATATQDSFARPSKIVKTGHHVVPSSSFVRSSSESLFQSSHSLKEDSRLAFCSSRSSSNFVEEDHFGKKNVEETSKEGLKERSESSDDNRHDRERNVESNDMWRPW